MDAQQLNELGPIVACLAVFGAPVVWYFVKQHFALKRRELELEFEERRVLAAAERERLELRLQRLEAASSSAGDGAGSVLSLLEPPPQAAPQARGPGRREPSQ